MRIHMTAIGGTGMGALAGLLGEAGHEVRGSDGPLYPPMSTLLAELGVPLFEGYAASNLDWDPDLVVIGNTCKSDHVELLAARERDLRCVSFPQLLGEMFLAERWPVVVAGTHGKTTTTSLMAHVLRHAGIDPGYLIGGIPVDFGRSFALGSGEPFVVEGDEYDSACFDKRPKFVHYAPRTAIVTSIELDHVVLNGPSRNPKYKDKYFDVTLAPDPKAFEKPDVSKLGKSGKIGESKIKLPDTTPPDPNIEVEDTRPKESVYDATSDTWTLGTDDYKNVNVDDLARYAKVVHDREGNPLGIQISDDIPDDNSVIARGGRKGDIIKAINGQKVASMSDVRRIVRTEYNNGTEEFVVTFERDGVPGTKIFKVPKKK